VVLHLHCSGCGSSLDVKVSIFLQRQWSKSVSNRLCDCVLDRPAIVHAKLVFPTLLH
jgi:hypothetical protein